MSRSIIRFSTAAAAAVALAVLPGWGLIQVAQAAPAEPVTVRIPVKDLDLSRPDDARLLKARIKAAGETVCRDHVPAERPDRWSARACRSGVRDEAVSKLSPGQARALRAVGG